MPAAIVVAGASLGGLHALQAFVAGLPHTLLPAIAIVQHRIAGSDDFLRLSLQRHTHRQVREAEDKEQIETDRLYLAPADYHLLVEEDHFALSLEPKVSHARPSIDVLFESAARAFGSRTLGIIFSGANEDGAAGLRQIKEYGGTALVQDPATAECPQMPEAALAQLTPDEVLRPEEMGRFIMDYFLMAFGR
jgi:two-component system, chemotaxis family, protein-glutamate methylesterase/glutaminase